MAQTWGEYLGNRESCSGTATGLCYTDDQKYALRAREEFLYQHWTVCTQGIGKVEDGRYISCTVPITWSGLAPEGNRDNIRFEWKPEPARFQAFKTAAVNSAGPIPYDQNVQIYIPGLVPHLTKNNFSHPSADGWFTVNDAGGGLSLYSIDLYVGEGGEGFHAYTIVRELENAPVYRKP
jgi:hypothetical protein